MLLRLRLFFATLLLISIGAQAQPEYFDIVTYNIEWLGKPQKAGLSISRDEQLTLAAEDIYAASADIYALQEIIIDDLNGNALEDLLVKLNEIDEVDSWSGGYNTYFSYWWDPDFANYPAQRQAFVYRNSTVSNVTFKTLLTDVIEAGDNRFGTGRLPFLMEADVTIGDVMSRVSLVNLHLKCCGGSSSRRKYSMETLVEALDQDYRDGNMIVLGDLNVADYGGANGEIATWGIYNDLDNDGTADYVHAAGAVEDLSWYDIDHILVSNELYDNWLTAPEAIRNQELATSVSDHKPIKSSLVLTDIENIPPVVSIISPLTATSLDYGQSVSIDAEASDSDGSISKVVFYANGIKLGEDTSSPYSYSWQSPMAGDYLLKVIAFDNLNAQTTSDPVEVRVNDAQAEPLTSKILLNWEYVENNTYAKATVSVVHEGMPVSNAKVAISWSGDKTGSMTATTDQSGAVTFSTPNIITPSEITFTINQITKADFYWDKDNSQQSETISRSITSLEADKKELFTIYPNPLSDNSVIDITTEEAGIWVVHLYDSKGRYLKNLISNYYLPGRYQVKINHLKLGAGVYFATVLNEGKVIKTIRLVK